MAAASGKMISIQSIDVCFWLLSVVFSLDVRRKVMIDDGLADQVRYLFRLQWVVAVDREVVPDLTAPCLPAHVSLYSSLSS